MQLSTFYYQHFTIIILLSTFYYRYSLHSDSAAETSCNIWDVRWLQEFNHFVFQLYLYSPISLYYSSAAVPVHSVLCLIHSGASVNDLCFFRAFLPVISETSEFIYFTHRHKLQYAGGPLHKLKAIETPCTHTKNSHKSKNIPHIPAVSM